MGGSQGIVETVAANRIPIKVCSIKGQTVSSYNHQLTFWRNRDHPVIICTDDKGCSQPVFLRSGSVGTVTYSAVDENEIFNKELRNLWRTHFFGIKTLMCKLECTAWVFYNDIVMTNSKSGYTVINGN